MILKNYTSNVPASTTIFRIQQFLIKSGVSQLSMDYGLNGEVVAVTFSIQIEANRRPISIRLPANTEGAHEALWMDYLDGDKERDRHDGDKEAAYGSRKRLLRSSFKEQASRTAWRVVQDWVEIQLSMIAMKQADFMQVFLPYAWDGKQSYYQRLKTGGFAALMPPKEHHEHLEAVP
jgi:hypothetical protein